MLELTTGDTAPGLSGICSNKDPVTQVVTVADLTGATVEVHVRRADGSVVTKTATLVDADEGSWSTTWSGPVGDDPADLSVNGTYFAEAQVTYSGGLIQTFGPVPFKVRRQIA